MRDSQGHVQLFGGLGHLNVEPVYGNGHPQNL